MSHFKTLVLLAALLAAISLSLPSLAAPEWVNRPGSIGRALTQEDGATVYLDAVTVDSIEAAEAPTFFVVRDMWNLENKITVNVVPPTALQPGQTIDVEGTLATQTDGSREVVNPRIIGYYDSSGKLMVKAGIIRGLFEPTPWQWKSELTAGDGLSVQSGPGTPGDPPPGPGPDIVLIPGSIAYAKFVADGQPATINGKRVICEDPEVGIYVQEPDRIAGIRVVYTGAAELERGATVDITGTMATTADGEREILAGAAGVTVVSPTGTVADPVGINNRTVGGAAFNTLTPGINFPEPAIGLSNKGQLVKTWGVVTAVDIAAKCYYLDDGSLIENGTDKPLGLKVTWKVEGTPTSLPTVGDFLTDVVGISSSEAKATGSYARLLKIRTIAKPVVEGTALSKLVDLSWTPQDHTIYNIYRATNVDGPYDLMDSVVAGSFRDIYVFNGTTYYYKVIAEASGIQGAASDILTLTPTGGSPTLDVSVDEATSTYTYTVTCPANSEFPFSSLEVRATVKNASPTTPWSGSGPMIGTENLNWPMTIAAWDISTGNEAAKWDAQGQAVPENTAAVATFTLVVPESQAAGGTVYINGTAFPVLVPGPKPIITPTFPPETSITLAGTLGTDGWYVSPVTVTISATDPDGDYSKSYYKKDDPTGAWKEYTAALDESAEGTHKVVAYSVDVAGNSENPDEPKTSEFKIDTTAPTVTGEASTQPNASGWYKQDVQINYTATDAVSGLAVPEAAAAGTQVQFSQTASGEGEVSITGSATDKAGNTASKTVSVKIDKTAPTLTLVSAPTGSNHVINYDQCVIRFTAADSGSGIDGVPTVTVSITPTEGWADPSTTVFNASLVGPDTYEVSFPFMVPGIYSVSLSAADKAGNTAQSAVPIAFGAGGFTVLWLPPISNMDIYVMEDGSTVPVKFRLLDPANNNVYVNNYLYTVKVIDDASKVWLQVTIPAADLIEQCYKAIVKTKDADNVDWPLGHYTVVIEGPGIWDVVSGPYRSRYGLDIVARAVAKGTGRK